MAEVILEAHNKKQDKSNSKGAKGTKIVKSKESAITNRKENTTAKSKASATAKGKASATSKGKVSATAKGKASATAKSKERVTAKNKESSDPEESLVDFLFNEGGKEFDAKESQSEESPPVHDLTHPTQTDS